MANFDSLKFAVEGISGGATTIIMDNAELPSFMNPFYKKTNAQLFGGSGRIHSAWNVGGAEKNVFYFSKFINTIVNGRAYSWPNVIPCHSKTFEEEMCACNLKGAGWHQASIAEWAAIVYLLHKAEYEPRGNTDCGKNHVYTYETGAADTVGRTSSGSGPVSWNHDGNVSGISDFVGNLWKRLSGMRIIEGEIQIMNGNEPALQVSHADSSESWKAIMPDGSLVIPGTTGTLHYNENCNIGTSIITTGSFNKEFSGITADVELPEIIYELLLAPKNGMPNIGNAWVTLDGERITMRGGCYDTTSYAGTSALNLDKLRSVSDGSIGFYSAYHKL